MEPQRVVHTERATANVLHGANRATRAPSSLQGENESTRADPSPRWREASPPAPPRQTKRQSAARPGAGPGSYRVGWPAGPLGCRPGLRTHPRPAPEWNLEMDTRRPGRARIFTRAHARHTLRTVPKPRHPGGSRTLDSGSGAAASRRRRSTPPTWSGQQVQARRLPGCAAVPSPRRAALRLPSPPPLPPPPPPKLPRLPPAGLAGGPADSATPSSAPATRSSPAPRPGHAHWPTRGLRTREGAVPAGKQGPKGGRGAPRLPPLTTAAGLLGSPPSSTWFPFHRQETKGWRGCLFASPLLREGRAVRPHSIQPGERSLLVSPRRKLGPREGKPLVRGYSAPGAGPRSARSPSSPCAEFPASALAVLPAFSPSPLPASAPFVSPPPTLPGVEGPAWWGERLRFPRYRPP